MSNVRLRKNIVFDTDSGNEPDIQSDDVQPDAGWTLFFRIAAVVFVLLPTLMLLRIIFFIDVPFDPVVYSLPDPPKLEGALAPNDLLVYQGRRAYEGKVRGPESIVYSHGHIYTGTADGKILHINHAKGEIEELVTLGKPPCGSHENEQTCGRPLGMRFDKDGYLIVLDAYLGIYQINVATRDVFELFPASMKVDGQDLKFLNDLDIAPDGMIYFTDSAPFHRRQFPLALIEGTAKGRLLRHNPVENTTEVLLDHLFFANGVQVSRDGSYVLVAETGMARIQKYHLKGPKQGQAEMFAENLPGFVDNIRSSSGGGYWAAMGLCRHQGRYNILDMMAQYPRVRKQLAKIPTKYFTVFLPKCSIIAELNKKGEIVRSLQDLNGERLQFISEVEDDAGILYIGSFTASYIGIVNTDKKPPSA